MDRIPRRRSRRFHRSHLTAPRDVEARAAWVRSVGLAAGSAGKNLQLRGESGAPFDDSTQPAAATRLGLYGTYPARPVPRILAASFEDQILCFPVETEETLRSISGGGVRRDCLKVHQQTSLYRRLVTARGRRGACGDVANHSLTKIEHQALASSLVGRTRVRDRKQHRAGSQRARVLVVLLAVATSSSSCAYGQAAPPPPAADSAPASPAPETPATTPGGSAKEPDEPISERLDPSAATEFTRFRRVSRLEANLEASVTRYRHPVTRSVLALVAAIHIGDPSYFRGLQGELDRYDLVLFERVGSEDEAEAPKREIFTLFAELQREVSKLLEFQHQMEGIDYTRGNLRHADLSLREFEDALNESDGPQILPLIDDRAARLIAPFLRIGFALSKEINKGDPQFTNRMRWQFGALLGRMDKVAEQLGVDDLSNPDDAIIGMRNKHAWEVFEESQKEGFQRTAIYYGAAHMPDFERRLLESGWVREDQSWFPAWHIPVPASDESAPSRAERVDPIAPDPSASPPEKKEEL